MQLKRFLEAKTMSDITQGNISISYSLKDIGRLKEQIGLFRKSGDI